MKIKGLTLEQITSAAQEAGHFKLDNVRTIGNYTFFVLRMASSTPKHCLHKIDGVGEHICSRLRGHEGPHWERLGNGKITMRWQDNEGTPATSSMRYRKRSIGRMIHSDRGPEYGIAVCFHGFRAFMRACFARNPQAIIRTARAAYLGVDDFESKWPAVGAQNVGSQFCPVSYAECCDC